MFDSVCVELHFVSIRSAPELIGAQVICARTDLRSTEVHLACDVQLETLEGMH